MTAALKSMEIETELQLISQKLRFLVKICKEADSDTENRFCVELVGRELSAYAGTVDEMISGLKKGPGLSPPKGPPQKPAGAAPPPATVPPRRG